MVKMLAELAKLNTPGLVHAQELYAAINIIRRCPPGPIFDILVTNPKIVHVGDLYFRLENITQEN